MNPLDVVIGQFKTGYRTSEFWVVVFAAAVNSFIGIWNPSQSWKPQVTGITVAVVAAVYASVRTYNKGKRLNVLSAIAAALNAVVGSETNVPATPVGPTGSTGSTGTTGSTA